MLDNPKASLCTDNKQGLHETKVSNMKFEHSDSTGEEQCGWKLKMGMGKFIINPLA